MKAPQTLRRPSNWQDFETLCKKLWGEIWNCAEIKKNGRAGQDQHGVDVYGIPFGENSYYGIQCKGKDEYTQQQFTETEITNEIEKAKLFHPPLKKLYFATTAVKDAKIEAFVRQKNLENMEVGLFEVHIFSWEDIVDLIDENPNTHDWYIQSLNYKGTHSVEVVFDDGTTEITLTPKFKQSVTRYMQERFLPNEKVSNMFAEILKQQKHWRSISQPVSFTWEKVNLSYSMFRMRIKNTGRAPIEDYKLLFEFEGELEAIADTNIDKGGFAIVVPQFVTTTYIFPETKSGKIVPRNNILVGDDTFRSNEIFVKPTPKQQTCEIKWKLISKNYKKEGVLKINFIPHVEKDYNTIIVENPEEAKLEYGPFEDYIVDKKDGQS